MRSHEVKPRELAEKRGSLGKHHEWTGQERLPNSWYAISNARELLNNCTISNPFVELLVVDATEFAPGFERGLRGIFN